MGTTSTSPADKEKPGDRSRAFQSHRRRFTKWNAEARRHALHRTPPYPEARLPFNAWRHRGLVMRVGGPGQALRCRGAVGWSCSGAGHTLNADPSGSRTKVSRCPAVFCMCRTDETGRFRQPALWARPGRSAYRKTSRGTLNRPGARRRPAWR